MEETTLLILAAGMGSRFGGLKQIEPVDKAGNFIIDYSIFDALRVGFNKVVFVIKKENLEIFKSTVGSRIEKFVKVEYAFQELNSFVNCVPDGRVKPWGTGHAVLCAKDYIKGKFAIINADDFYGLDAFKTTMEFLQNNNDSKRHGMIVYKIGNTLTENGDVKRGLCTERDGYLVGMTESFVGRKDGQIVATPLAGGDSFVLDFNSPVSMNLICLNSDIFEFMEKEFKNFLLNLKDPLKSECMIQDILFSQMNEMGAKVEVVPTSAVWHGVTFKEDKPALVEAIKNLVDRGEYPQNLWAK